MAKEVIVSDDFRAKDGYTNKKLRHFDWFIGIKF